MHNWCYYCTLIVLTCHHCITLHQAVFCMTLLYNHYTGVDNWTHVAVQGYRLLISFLWLAWSVVHHKMYTKHYIWLDKACCVMWKHQMETFSALLAICAGNSPVTGEFSAQRPVTRSFDVTLICTWINGWVSNREAGDLGRHRTYYDVTIM